MHTSERAARVGEQDVTPFRERDLQILRLIFEGKSNKEIAALMSFSHGTVRVYVSHILARLGVANRSAAAFTALEKGLIGPIPQAATAPRPASAPVPTH